jgi:hypothetical protein
MKKVAGLLSQGHSDQTTRLPAPVMPAWASAMALT